MRSLNDGEYADLLWTVRPAKLEDGTVVKSLNVTFYSCNVKIGQFKQEPMDESRKYKLVISLMMENDEFKVLMM